MKKLGLFIFAVMVAQWGGAARAVEDPAVRAQVKAATEDAVQTLLWDVSRVGLTRDLTAGDVIRRTRSSDEVVKVLRRAQQLGGPRWIDDHTCQVELQISGPVVASALKRAVAANPRLSPVSVKEMDRLLKDWDDRSFTATGQATGRIAAAGVGKTPGGAAKTPDPWQDISLAAREQAIAAAKTDAARRTIASVKPIELTPKSTVGDVLAVKDVGSGMEDWLTSRPTSRVELRDDFQAEVELSTTPSAMFTEFQDLAEKQREVKLPSDEQGWRPVKEAFEQKMAKPVGRGVVPADAAMGAQVVGARPLVGLAARAPEWASRRLEDSGSVGAQTGRSKLKAARDAEAAAEVKLRKQIDGLQLEGGKTVGEAAKADPKVEKAIERALARTRISRAEYRDDGGATVDVYLDLAILWDELRDAQ